MLYLMIILNCVACKGNVIKDSPYSSQRDGLKDLPQASSADATSKYPQPVSFAKKGRFCLLLFGDTHNEEARNADISLSTAIDKNTTDYFFVDLSKWSEDALTRFQTDFGALQCIYLLSASGNLLLNISLDEKLAVDTALKSIDRMTTLYVKNGIDPASFKKYSRPVVHKGAKDNFFKVGTFGNIIVPADFVVPGKVSVLIFSNPGCPPCVALKEALLTDNTIDPAKCDFYYVDLSADANLNQHTWDATKVTPEMKVYAMEGTIIFPTVWIISSSGSVCSVVNGNTIGDITLLDYIRQSVTRLSGNNPEIIDKPHPDPVLEGELLSANKLVVSETKPEPSAAILSLAKINIVSGKIILFYSIQNTPCNHKVEITITKEKGNVLIMHESVDIKFKTGDRVPFEYALKKAVVLKKRTNYLISICITSGNETIFKVTEKAFSTNQYNNAIINF